MKNLTLNLEDEISILSKYRITPNELMFIRTLLILQDDDNEDLFSKYLQTLVDGGFKIRDVILCLQEKGVILKYKIPLITSGLRCIHKYFKKTLLIAEKSYLFQNSLFLR